MFIILLLSLQVMYTSQTALDSSEGLVTLKNLYGKLCTDGSSEPCLLLQTRISTLEDKILDKMSASFTSAGNNSAQITQLNEFLTPLFSSDSNLEDCDTWISNLASTVDRIAKEIHSAGPKGLCAKSARAVTGRRCPHSGEGEVFFTRHPSFFYENGHNSGTNRINKKLP